MTMREDLEHKVRDARRRYDKLSRGETASLRRCRTANESELESIFWKVNDSQRIPNFAHVVVLFPLANARLATRPFSFGSFLRGKLGDTDSAALRFRRVLESRTRDELDHRLRGLLKLATADGSRVDWGVLGVDVLWFFGERDSVRRRWAQDFYAPLARSRAQTEATTFTRIDQ
jgi:CRISPR type I-E-associated protein CasB/Cse2